MLIDKVISYNINWYDFQEEYASEIKDITISIPQFLINYSKQKKNLLTFPDLQ